MADKKIPARKTRTGKKEKQGYANTEPITDPMEALELLFTRGPDQEVGLTKSLMPYGVLGPLPRWIKPEENRYLPFVEWSWYGGLCNLELLGARDYLISSSVADKLIREEWVEKTSVMFVYTISLLGIAIAAAHRLKKIESAIGGGSVSDPD